MENLNDIFGFLYQFPTGYLTAGIVLVALILGFTGAPLILWVLGAAVLLAGFGAPVWAWAVFGVVATLFVVTPIRRAVLSNTLMKLMEALKFLPTISETEQTAIEAGTVWMDGELFSGKPNFKRLMEQDYPDLTPEEKAFIDGPVEELCGMVNDWDVFMEKGFGQDVWDFLKKNKFFGLIIEKKYGGLEFSASANSAVVAKVSSRCGPLATTVMVPNSLGPAELLTHYGTEEQKSYYLPRLADGTDLPAFALTEPNAGSDAGGMESYGEVVKNEDGELYLKLNWDKRYITLAAISTVLGLAFKLRDPNNYLGKGENLGITCALIPTDTPGVELGKRHDPLGVPFYNCPTRGKDVMIPVSAIIGGPEQAGNGWRMLMESLAAGRGISLPASAAGGTQLTARVTGAYARIRKQFGLPIGKFEGIEEPLARIGGYNYIIEAARRYTNGALNAGAKPAVITAMMKYNTTEMARKAVIDGMDILGGAAISRGPRNTLAHAYVSAPIGITVEGANILTRTLMIFGQGAIRCHPYAYKEIDALTRKDLKAFDSNFWKHVGHVNHNLFRSILLSVTRGRLTGSPVNGPSAKYFKRMAWASASFAFLADVALGSFGGGLKLKEKLTGRFADIFSMMYLGSAVLRRFEAEGRPKEDEAYLHWSMQYIFAEIQRAFDEIYKNFDVPLVGWVFKYPVRWWNQINSMGSAPADYLGHQVARAMQQPGAQRDRQTPTIYVSKDKEDALGRYEHALMRVIEGEKVFKKIYVAMKAKKLPKAKPFHLIDKAVEAGVITKDEADTLRKAEEVRFDAILVDEFTLEEYRDNMPRPRKAAKAAAIA